METMPQNLESKMNRIRKEIETERMMQKLDKFDRNTINYAYMIELARKKEYEPVGKMDLLYSMIKDYLQEKNRPFYYSAIPTRNFFSQFNEEEKHDPIDYSI